MKTTTAPNYYVCNWIWILNLVISWNVQFEIYFYLDFVEKKNTNASRAFKVPLQSIVVCYCVNGIFNANNDAQSSKQNSQVFQCRRRNMVFFGRITCLHCVNWRYWCWFDWLRETTEIDVSDIGENNTQPHKRLLTFESVFDLSRRLDFPLITTLAFLNWTSHGDGGSHIHVSSGSGSVDVSTVRSPSSTKPDSPGCKLKKKMN